MQPTIIHIEDDYNWRQLIADVVLNNGLRFRNLISVSTLEEIRSEFSSILGPVVIIMDLMLGDEEKKFQGYHWLLEELGDFLKRPEPTAVFVISGQIHPAVRETLVRRGIPKGHIYGKSELAEQRDIFLDALRQEMTNFSLNLHDSSKARKELAITVKNAQADNRSGGEIMNRLGAIKPGQGHASQYQQEMLNIVSQLFDPYLSDGTMEEATIDGTERRDIIFTNDSDQPFWKYVRDQYSNYLVMFEAKNVRELKPEHINQVATYLGDRIGRLGFILTRNPARETHIRKTIAVFNDSRPRKVIIILHDKDIEEMLRLKEQGNEPSKYLQQKYRRFKLDLQ